MGFIDMGKDIEAEAVRDAKRRNKIKYNGEFVATYSRGRERVVGSLSSLMLLRRTKESRLAEIQDITPIQALRNLLSTTKDYHKFLGSGLKVYMSSPDCVTYNPKEVRQDCKVLSEIYGRYQNPDMLAILKYAEEKYPQMFLHSGKKTKGRR
jgi:hypothetical protein